MRRLGLALAFFITAALAFGAGVVAMALHNASQPTPTPVVVAASPAPTITEPSPAITLASPTALLAQVTATRPPPSPSATRRPQAPRTPTIGELRPDDPALALLILANAERETDGCTQPLEWEPRLALIAEAHALDMATTGRIDHVSSDGATYTDRLDASGYLYVRRGENIAAGYRDPAEVMAIWMDEPEDGPHRTNILNCVYSHAGVGYAVDASGYPYWVLDLAEPQP